MKLIISMMICLSAYSSTKVIYGEDNRIDWYEINDSAHRELARSTAAMISTDKLKTSSADLIINGKTLLERGMCQSERFANQMTAANCSGFLVGEDLLVTAGHCITGQSACNKNSWVFDYRLEFEGDKANIVSKESVYKCTEIIERSQSFWTKDDYALIRLDRKVTDRRALNFRKSGTIEVGSPLMVIGHPTGLPMKLADGANVRELKNKFFKANLDTYGGNSGSAVFNTETLQVEGILVRGDTDYVSKDGCKVSYEVGQDEGRGEDVTYITNIKALK